MSRTVMIQSARRKRRAPSPEHLEQKAVIDWRNVYRGQSAKLALLISVPNAGRRSFGAANWLRAEGLTAGAPDLLLLAGDNEGKYNYLAIEMKAKGGLLSDYQKKFLLDVRDVGGGKVSICFSALEAITTIVEYLNLPRSWIPK